MWWIIASLIVLGILLMFVELLILPGVGIAGVMGLASLAGSCVYAFLKIGDRAGIIVTVIVVVLILAMIVYVLRARTWKRFELKTEIDSKVGAETEGVKVSDKGTTLTRLAPMGTAKFESTSCEVKSYDNNMVAPGTEIEVVSIEDNKILVKPIKQQ